MPAQNTLLDLSLESLPVSQILQMYNLLPDILFWIKDPNSKIVYANSCFLEHLAMGSLEQVIGLDDYDFAPKHIAKQFIADDLKVVSGEVVTDRLEMNILGSGEIAWFTTSKRPLFDHQGRIVGSYGISRHLEKTSIVLTGMVALKAPVSFIRENFARKISMHELAEVAHLSVSALERRFKKFLLKTPQQYITEVRLENARRLLVETTLPISVIADESGIPDPSYFSRKFQQQFSLLPSEFRDSYQ